MEFMLIILSMIIALCVLIAFLCSGYAIILSRLDEVRPPMWAILTVTVMWLLGAFCLFSAPTFKYSFIQGVASMILTLAIMGLIIAPGYEVVDDLLNGHDTPLECVGILFAVWLIGSWIIHTNIAPYFIS